MVKTGDRLHIEFDGTLKSDCIIVKDTRTGGEGEVAVYQVNDDKENCIHYVYLDAGIYRKADPKDWPPEPGDIWEKQGHEYFARPNTLYPDQLSLIGDDGDGYFGNTEVERFKALNPRLVRRRA
jgi:hypothetical protein